MAGKVTRARSSAKALPKASAKLEKTMKAMDSPEDRADVETVPEAVEESSPPAYQGHDRRP